MQVKLVMKLLCILSFSSTYEHARGAQNHMYHLETFNRVLKCQTRPGVMENKFVTPAVLRNEKEFFSIAKLLF